MSAPPLPPLPPETKPRLSGKRRIRFFLKRLWFQPWLWSPDSNSPHPVASSSPLCSLPASLSSFHSVVELHCREGEEPSPLHQYNPLTSPHTSTSTPQSFRSHRSGHLSFSLPALLRGQLVKVLMDLNLLTPRFITVSSSLNCLTVAENPEKMDAGVQIRHSKALIWLLKGHYRRDWKA